METDLTLVGVVIVASLISLVLALHPFLTYPLSLILLRALPGKSGRQTVAPQQASLARALDGATARPRIAMLMCAYNEEKVIEAKVRNLLALRHSDPDVEILVYVDCGSDRTAQILSAYSDQIRVHIAGERHGKTHGMNLLVGMTRADILVFTDANVMVAPDVLDRVRSHFADPTVGCIAGHVEFTNAGESVTAASGSLYWRYEEWVKRLEGDTGSVMGATGGLFAIRSKLHESAPDHIIDDMYVSFMTLCHGYRIVQAEDVLGYEESVSSMNEEYRRKVRIACQAFNAHKLIWPRLRKTGGLTVYKYLSHKYLRWLTIYFLGAAVVFAEVGLVLAGLGEVALLLLLAAALALYAGHRFRMKPFVQVVDILSALAGTGVGVWRSVRGDLYQTWTPAASIRKS